MLGAALAPRFWLEDPVEASAGPFLFWRFGVVLQFAGPRALLSGRLPR